MDAAQLRNLVKEVSGRDISTDQATSFLGLFKDELDTTINQARRTFVIKHFGSRHPLHLGIGD